MQLFLLLLFLHLRGKGVVGDGHGLFCATQFNAWYVRTPQSFAILPNLTEGMDPCAVQAYSDRVYAAYVALGKGTDGYAGYPSKETGMNTACTDYDPTTIGPQGGLPAGGCTYSYPAFTRSTCRIQTNSTHELQWCYNDLEASLRLGRTTVPTQFVTSGDPLTPYNNSLCDEEIKDDHAFDESDYGSPAQIQHYLYPRFRLYASTRLNICDHTMNDNNNGNCDPPSPSPSSSKKEKRRRKHTIN